MKKFIIIPVFAVLLMSAAARPSVAVTISAGPVVWYSWWNPIFEDALQFKQMSALGIFPYSSYRMNPVLLYGPTISVGAGNWSVSSVFTMGTYHARAQGALVVNPSNITPFQNNIVVRKYDLDVTLNYRLTDMVKLFWGFKYQRYGWSATMNMGSGGMIEKNTIDAPGTGFGISLNIHLAGNLYLLSNISAVYLLNINSYDQIVQAGKKSGNNRDHGVGGNVTLSLAYFIEPINTTISLGCRYQYIKFLTQRDETLSNSRNPRDQFFGVTLSAVYSFEI